MVKGVNKAVIEINDTQDSYIERAILFINPDKASHPQNRLKTQANAYLQHTSSDMQSLPAVPKKKKIVIALSMVFSFLGGAAAMYGIFAIIG